jgi:solute carrier family 25 (mitochondrial phosphate transporter), member 3
VKNRTLIYLGSATVAECVKISFMLVSDLRTNEMIFFRLFADVLLTPLEAIRIRLVSQRGYATGLVSGFTRIAKEGGLRELYAGFLPILCKYVFSLFYSKFPDFLKTQTNTLRNRSIHR